MLYCQRNFLQSSTRSSNLGELIGSSILTKKGILAILTSILPLTIIDIPNLTLVKYNK